MHKNKLKTKKKKKTHFKFRISTNFAFQSRISHLKVAFRIFVKKSKPGLHSQQLKKKEKWIRTENTKCIKNIILKTKKKNMKKGKPGLI